MTLSVAARCPRSGQFGVAAVCTTPGIIHLLTHARAGVGAVATQGMINPYLAHDGFEELARGRDAEQALRVVMANDPGRHLRQCGIVDAAGGSAAWTGEDTIGWSGHVTADGVAVQGNRLAGEETLKRVLDRFEDGGDLALGDRLIRALEVLDGDEADERGITSAGLVVVETEAYPLCDARIDRSATPVADLRALHDELAATVTPRVAKLPSRDDPLGQLARESTDAIG